MTQTILDRVLEHELLRVNIGSRIKKILEIGGDRGMNNFEIHDRAEELLTMHTPYKLTRELVILKEEHENLLWEYKQAQKELEELRGDTSKERKNTFGSPVTEQDATDWAITMVDEGW